MTLSNKWEEMNVFLLRVIVIFSEQKYYTIEFLLPLYIYLSEGLVIPVHFPTLREISQCPLVRLVRLYGLLVWEVMEVEGDLPY
jgi:hypothetical protein